MAWDILEPLRKSFLEWLDREEITPPYKETDPEYHWWLENQIVRGVSLYYDIMSDETLETD